MKAYLELLSQVLENGTPKTDRTGTGTRSLFGQQVRYDLAAGFPLVTTKQVHFKSVVHELLWFLSGKTNVAYLNRHGVTIWDDWADEDGNLGPTYGRQWRSWPVPGMSYIDQVQQVVDDIRADPDSRRLLVCAWNVGELKFMRLPPCHVLFQFYVADGRLSCQLYQRSADVFLGVPFNIASYSLLTRMMAQVCELKLGEFVHTLGDVHLYDNHVEQAEEQLRRTPNVLPRVEINPEVHDIFAFRYDDIQLFDYQAHPPIRAPVAV